MKIDVLSFAGHFPTNAAVRIGDPARGGGAVDHSDGVVDHGLNYIPLFHDRKRTFSKIECARKEVRMPKNRVRFFPRHPMSSDRVSRSLKSEGRSLSPHRLSNASQPLVSLQRASLNRYRGQPRKGFITLHKLSARPTRPQILEMSMSDRSGFSIEHHSVKRVFPSSYTFTIVITSDENA